MRQPQDSARRGELQARPAEGLRSIARLRTGLYSLGIGTGRDGLLYVPETYRVDEPARMAVMLHGAGGDADQGISWLQPLASANNLLILAPESRGRTWDVILRDYGPDVRYIDQALDFVLERYAIDPAHIAVGGFSDGASYALSLGISNGDLFTHIIAFSPGFMVPSRQEGQPRVFISHGTADSVLPVQRCSRRIVPQLRDAGYDVTYREFDGPHTVPRDIASDAVAWFTGAGE